jgi:hypothetical protein
MTDFDVHRHVVLDIGPQTEAPLDVQPPAPPDLSQGHEFYFQITSGIRVWVDRPAGMSKRYMLYAIAKAFFQELYQEPNNDRI